MGLLILQRWCKSKKDKLYTFAIRSDFGSIGKGSKICPPFHSGNTKNVYIGSNGTVNAGSWL